MKESADVILSVKTVLNETDLSFAADRGLLVSSNTLFFRENLTNCRNHGIITQ
jgi:hypothetical protein